MSENIRVRNDINDTETNILILLIRAPSVKKNCFLHNTTQLLWADLAKSKNNRYLLPSITRRIYKVTAFWIHIGHL